MKRRFLIRMGRALSLGIILTTVLLPGCAHKQRRAFLETPLQTWVDRKTLEAIGVNAKDLPPLEYDAKLVVFVSEFVRDAKEKGKLEIQTEMLEMLRQVKYVDRLTIGEVPGVMAACNRFYMDQAALGGTKRVKWLTIEVLAKESQEYTGTNPASELILLRELMYHELFHCLMNKGHLPEGMSGIMSPTFTKGSKRAFEDWDGLVKEMFSPAYIQAIPDAPAF